MAMKDGFPDRNKQTFGTVLPEIGESFQQEIIINQ